MDWLARKRWVSLTRALLERDLERVMLVLRVVSREHPESVLLSWSEDRRELRVKCIDPTLRPNRFLWWMQGFRRFSINLRVPFEIWQTARTREANDFESSEDFLSDSSEEGLAKSFRPRLGYLHLLNVPAVAA